METKEIEQTMGYKAKIFDLNDISKMPCKIEVNGQAFFFSMWITAWNKFAVGYETMDHRHSLISAVIEENLEKPYIIENYVQKIENKEFSCIIFSVQSFTIAFNALLNAISILEYEK